MMKRYAEAMEIMKRIMTVLLILMLVLMLGACGGDKDSSLSAAVDSYMRIVTQNDTKALDGLPPKMWDICRHSADEYKQYMRDNLSGTMSGGLKWTILTVSNPHENIFDVVIECGNETFTITLTKEDDIYIIDELISFFDSLSYEMENRSQ